MIKSNPKVETTLSEILLKAFTTYSNSNKIETEFTFRDGSSSSTVIPIITTISYDDDINNNSNNNNNSINKNNTENYLNLTWSKGLAVTIFLLVIFITIIGNTLVILSFFTTRRLRTVTNCFVMNLAITDWLVGTCVMPPAVVLYIAGSWKFGWILCDIWISLDVLLCTASILSLCAISLDRYLAVIQPLTYSKKRRSKRLAMFMIVVVWILAFSITCPPFFGWYEQGRRKSEIVDCRYNRNKGYVVFSAMGSFFIPATVMLYVYLNIGYVLSSRRQRMNLTEASEKSPENDIDCENYVTETDFDHLNIHCCHCSNTSPSLKMSFNNKFKSKTFDNNLSTCCHHFHHVKKSHKNGSGNIISSTTLYELVHISKTTSSMIRCATITGLGCDITSKCPHCGCKVAMRGPSGNIAAKELSSSDSIVQPSTSSNNNVVNAINRRTSNSDQIPVDKIHFNQTSFSDSNLSKYKIRHYCNHAIPHSSCIGHHYCHHHSKSNRIPMRVSTQKQTKTTKTTKTLTVVMGGFIICWLPFFLAYLLIPFLEKDTISSNLMLFLTWVGWFNCSINPFIYAFYNPDFRLAFWRLTFRRFFRPPSNHMAMFRG